MPNVRHLLGLLWTHLSSRLWTTSRPDKNHKLKVVPSFGNVLLSLFREEDAPGQGRSLLRYTLVRSSDLRCPVHWLNWIILLQGFSSLIWMEAKKRKNMENIKKKKYYWISEKKICDNSNMNQTIKPRLLYVNYWVVFLLCEEVYEFKVPLSICLLKSKQQMDWRVWLDHYVWEQFF